MTLLERIRRKIAKAGIAGLLSAAWRRLTIPSSPHVDENTSPHVDENKMILSLFDKAGTMIDVGACFGDTLMPFSTRGWRVLAFEPDPENRAELMSRIKGRKNISVSDLAIAEKDGETLSFYSSPESAGVSSLTPFTANHRPTAQVQTTRLDTFLAAAGQPKVDYLKIDAEGHDLFVLKTYPFQSAPPDAVLCEFENKKTRPLGYEMSDMADLLVTLGYTVFVSEWYPIERYGIRHTWRRFSPYPAALVDDNGWGNLVAVRGARMIHGAEELFRSPSSLGPSIL
jgi:FkbM family methyltransferase